MKYDFVCKSDPVSHINNRKTTTQDKSKQNIKGIHLSLGPSTIKEEKNY